jgi:hypothetical protein
LQFRHPFFDVDTYEGPTNGYYLELSAVNGYASIPSPDGILDLPNDEVEWTLSTWVRVPVPVSGSFIRYDLFSWLDAGTNRGVRVYFELSTSQLRLTIQLGIGSSITTITGTVNALAGAGTIIGTNLTELWSQWQHFAVSYKASDGGVGAGKLRTYWNGALLGVTDFTGLPHNLALVGPAIVGAFGGGGPFASADFDATKFFQRKLETGEMFESHDTMVEFVRDNWQKYCRPIGDEVKMVALQDWESRFIFTYTETIFEDGKVFEHNEQTQTLDYESVEMIWLVSKLERMMTRV